MKRINKLMILFLAVFIGIFLGATNSIMTLAVMPLLFILSLIIANEAIRTKKSEICIYILLLLCFQNFLIGLGAHLFGNTDEKIKLLTQIPFMVIFANWLLLQFCRKRDRKGNKAFLLLLIYMVVSLIFGRGSLQAILMNIRNMTVFFMGFEIGKYYINTQEKFELFLMKYNKILLFMLIVGILLMVGGYELYSIIGVDEVYIAKSDMNAVGTLNQRFFTTLSSVRVMRMGSLYYEPVNLAYLYAMGLIADLFYKSKKWYGRRKLTGIVISGVGLLLTFGKGGWLIALSTIAFVIFNTIYSQLLKKISRKMLYRVTIILTVIVAVIFCIYAYKNINTSANPHFWGVIRTWENVKAKPLGHGLGTGGNMAYALDPSKKASFDNGNPWLSTGGESAVLSFAYQIGIVGVGLFVLTLLLTTSGNKKSNTFYSKAMRALPIFLICVGILQDNTFTPQCIIPFMLFQGGSVCIFVNQEEGKN